MESVPIASGTICPYYQYLLNHRRCRSSERFSIRAVVPSHNLYARELFHQSPRQSTSSAPSSPSVIQVSLSVHLLPILVGYFCRQDQSESQVLGQKHLTLSPAINFMPVQVSHLIRRFGNLWESHSRTNCEPPETNSHSSLPEDPSKCPPQPSTPLRDPSRRPT